MTARKLLVAVVSAVLLAVAAVGGAWATGDHRSSARAQNDTITAARFAIVIDNNELASFGTLVRIQSGAESTEYVQTSTSFPVGKLPGRHKPPSVTLTRGFSTSLQIWSWHQAVLQGQSTAARKSVALVAYDATGKPVAKYWLTNAWPSKIFVTGKKVGGAEALTETVTLVCEDIQRVSV
jgi:phage tail-like protein